MANSGICSVCVRAAELGVNPDSSKTKVEWAQVLGVGEASVRRHFKHGPIPKGVPQTFEPNNEAIAPLRSPVTASPTENYRETWRGSEGEITVILEEKIDNEAILAKFGHDPNAVHIDGTLEESHWQLANGDWRHKYRFKTSRKTPGAEVLDIDPAKILAALRGKRVGTSEAVLTGAGAFVVSLNDTQFGKGEGGGTEATLKRLASCLDRAVERVYELRELGRDIGTLVIVGGGDIVEGCVIYPNQSFQIDLDRRGQINTAVSAILAVIDRLAPMFSKVVVLACKGNHGENRIAGNRTTLYDNDDTLVFEMAQQATSRDPNLAHVEYIIAQEEAGVYVDVAGWRLATTHGDIYAKGVQGATVDRKAQSWYKNMAMARNPIGSADILLTHHFHHNKMSDWGSCLWRQTPALDGGSLWFEQTSGEYSLPGMLSFVMHPADRYRDEEILR